MNKKLKISLIVTAVVLALLMLPINIWYLWVYLYAPEKLISNTFEVGLVEAVDGNQKYFVEVNSYDDCFELKFNYLLDENRTDFYSQGLQYYHSGDYGNVELICTDYSVLSSSLRNFWGWKTSYYNKYYGTPFVVAGTTRNNYASSNDYEDTLISSNPIDEDTYFRITLNEGENAKLYQMKFKGAVRDSSKDIKISGNMFDWNTYYYSYYDLYNVDYFAYLLFEGIQALPYGTNTSVLFEFGDLFEYYEDVDGSGEYKDLVTPENVTKVINDVKNYYTIKINKHEGRIQQASDSLFNCVNGSSDYNVGKIESNSYFIGRTVLNCGLPQFNLVLISEGNVALKLREDFIACYTQEKYKNKIWLSILIDLDYLSSNHLTFVGFTVDSGLDNFHIVECRTVQTIDGELVYSEVAYD